MMNILGLLMIVIIIYLIIFERLGLAVATLTILFWLVLLQIIL